MKKYQKKKRFASSCLFRKKWKVLNCFFQSFVYAMRDYASDKKKRGTKIKKKNWRGKKNGSKKKRISFDVLIYKIYFYYLSTASNQNTTEDTATKAKLIKMISIEKRFFCLLAFAVFLCGVCVWVVCVCVILKNNYQKW